MHGAEDQGSTEADSENKCRRCWEPWVWALVPSLQSLKQPVSLVWAQPVGAACSVISVGAELPKQLFYTKKSPWAIHPPQPMDSWGWQAPLEIPQLNLLLRAASTTAGRSGLRSVGISKDGDTTTSLGNLCQWLMPLTVKSFLPVFNKISWILVSVPCLEFWPWVPLRKVWLSSLLHPSSIYLHG